VNFLLALPKPKFVLRFFCCSPFFTN